MQRRATLCRFQTLTAPSKRDKWLSTEGRGDFAYDGEDSRLFAVRGAKLLRLNVEEWPDGDAIGSPELRKRIETDGKDAISLADDYRRYREDHFRDFPGAYIGVLTEQGRLAVVHVSDFSGKQDITVHTRVRTERPPTKSGNRGHTPESENKFEPFARLQCSGSGGGEGGLLSSTGFTFVKSSEPDAKKTRLVVSFASDRLDDDVTKYRVVAVGKDGRSFANESPESYSGRGRTTGVMTVICEFPVPDSNLEELRIERLKDAKSTGQSKGQPVSPSVAKPHNASRFHLVRGNTTWIGTDNAPLQYDDYDKLCYWLWDPHTVVLPRPTEGFFDFYKERTLRPGVSRMDVSRAEWPSGQPANITMPGTIDLPTYQLLLQPSVQRALNLSKEQRTKLQDISAKYWSERRQIAGKALDDMEAAAQRKMAVEDAKAGHKGSQGFVRFKFDSGVLRLFPKRSLRNWSGNGAAPANRSKTCSPPSNCGPSRTLPSAHLRSVAELCSSRQVLERLGVTKDQQDKLRALELQLQKEKDRRLRSATAGKMKKMLAVLTPQQLSQLREEQSPDKTP